jgi:serine protease Do
VANSDLRPADVITAVDGVPVTTAQELQKLVLTKKIGKEVALSVWRGGKSITVPVTPGELPQSPGARNLLASEEPKVESKISDAPHGLKVADIDKATADRLGLRQTTGVIVTDVAPESAASVAGIQKDDVITEIDSKAVASAEDARGVLSKSDPTKRAILLFLERKGQKTYAVLKLDK